MRSLDRRSLLASVALVAASLSACDPSGRVIVDNWGPPAGYAVLAGSVQRSDSGPAAGVEVSFSRCADPIGGFLASATTDPAGQFRVGAHLPPEGALPSGIADTLHLRCSIFLDRTGVVRDSIIIRFAATMQAAPVTTVHLVAP